MRVAALSGIGGSNQADPADPAAATPDDLDPVTFGRRVRHFRSQREMTLTEFSRIVGVSVSQLSLLENGRREPRVSLLRSLADALAVPVAELLAVEPPPDRRAALEIQLDRAQRSDLFLALGVKPVRPGRGLPLEVLESLVALHEELTRRSNASHATPEEARRANTEIRQAMRAADNYLPELEELGEKLIRKAGYRAGALTRSRHAPARQ